ncbi:membrane protein insertase YidC [uncultured Thiothrix sp.]|uniref:membrane protein insertase YidC n=1 Tax=uncultured Thiothrix sp. TaxID=223185 RepID=UPI0026172164|nr:membrane protein insertase YidC [uncultured Thiothrix sp.]
MMDSQRPFLYLTLIFLGFLLWTSWQQDHAPKPLPTPTTQTSTEASSVPSQTANSASSASQTVPAIPNGSGITTGAGQIVRVKTDVLDLQISTKGGDIVAADLLTYPISLEEKNKPVRILDLNGRSYVAQSGLQHQAVNGQAADTLAPNHLADFSVEKTEYALGADQAEVVVPLVWQGPNGVVVTKRYRLKKGSFDVSLEEEVKNNSSQVWVGSEYRQLKHGPSHVDNNVLTSGVRAFVGGAYYADDKYKKLNFKDMKEPLTATATGGWVSMLEHYFISAWIPPQDQQNTYYSMELQQNGTPNYILGVRSPVKEIVPGGVDTFKSQIWIGPKVQDDLEKIAKGLDLTVDYGIFAFVSKPIFWLMQAIHSFVGNWGWTIILLTLFIKLLFFWPSAASYKSMAKMKAVSPKMKEINERFSGDPQAKQKAMMELYKKEKINPLGGCLPILIQIPVFMGLYWVLLESVELRQAPWILWYKDLSIMDPYFVLPLLMGASMFLQQKLNPPQMDPVQQKIFQFLPLIFTFMFLWFPAGLVLYWVVNNVLSIAQQWFINKKIVGHA